MPVTLAAERIAEIDRRNILFGDDIDPGTYHRDVRAWTISAASFVGFLRGTVYL